MKWAIVRTIYNWLFHSDFNTPLTADQLISFCLQSAIKWKPCNFPCKIWFQFKVHPVTPPVTSPPHVKCRPFTNAVSLISALPSNGLLYACVAVLLEPWMENANTAKGTEMILCAFRHRAKISIVVVIRRPGTYAWFTELSCKTEPTTGSRCVVDNSLKVPPSSHHDFKVFHLLSVAPANAPQYITLGQGHFCARHFPFIYNRNIFSVRQFRLLSNAVTQHSKIYKVPTSGTLLVQTTLIILNLL